MSPHTSRAPLRQVLLTDAATCALTGLTLTSLAGPLAELFRLPARLLFYAGLALLPIAALMAFVGVRAEPSAPWVRLIIVGNAAWALGSFGLLVSDLIAPNALGATFIAVQALVVVWLTVLEIKSLTPGLLGSADRRLAR